MDFDLKQIAGMLLKRWLMILLAALLCAGLFYSYAVLYVTPMYSSSVKMIVSSQGNYTGLSVAEASIPTYSNLLREPAMLAETADSLGLEDVKYSAGAIAGMISVSAVPDTGIFVLTVTCANKEHAPIIANKVATVAMPKIAEESLGNEVEVKAWATGAWKVSPNERRNAIYGFLVGAVLSAAVLVLFELLDTAIKSEDDLKEVAADVPVIGIIPSVEIPADSAIRAGKRTN